MKTRLLFFVITCATTFQLIAQDALFGLRQGSDGFAPVVPGKIFEFPRDHLPHTLYKTEWWYLTTNLIDETGKNWGLQWTLFRQALSSDQRLEGWQNNQLWMAHAAISTPDKHYHAQRFARGGIGQAGVKHSNGHFEAWIDDWQWSSEGENLFPARLRFSLEAFDVSLDLKSNGPLVFHGDNGFSLKSEQGQASYYYSQPHITVRADISKQGSSFSMSGKGWLDREWSTEALADNQQGWDWFSLHIEDGNKLMLYQLRNDDGNHHLSGSLIDPEGQLTHLSAKDIELGILKRKDIKLEGKTITDIPLEWEIKLTGSNQSWQIKPLYDDQWMDTQIPYWEGIVNARGTNGTSNGIGYMELTGYDTVDD